MGSIPGLCIAVAFLLRLSILLVKNMGEEYEAKYPFETKSSDMVTLPDREQTQLKKFDTSKVKEIVKTMMADDDVQAKSNPPPQKRKNDLTSFRRGTSRAPTMAASSVAMST